MNRDHLIETYLHKQTAIQSRLAEFAALRTEGDDARLFEELVYCIFTAGASARMGLTAIERIRPLLIEGAVEQIVSHLTGVHRFPNARAHYVIQTRQFLLDDCQMRLRHKLGSFGSDNDARRDYFAANTGILGIGYKEASHFLRNVGYQGYAILDKHILSTLADFGVIESAEPPATKKKYLALEEKMRKFAEELTIDFDELDLLLWSNKTGEILK